MKALQKDGDAFRYLKTLFPNLSDAMIKEGLFVGPQIKKLLDDSKFLYRKRYKSYLMVI